MKTPAKSFFIFLLLGALLCAPIVVYAHPMGNFSISHYSRLTLDSGTIEIRYLIDMAEIPTYQEIQQTGLVPNVNDPSAMIFAAKQAELLRKGISLEINGKEAAIETLSYQVIFPPGAGNLPTMKLGFFYQAKLPNGILTSPYRLHYVDRNFEGRAGWKEIVVSARAASILESSAPETDRSSELSNYPTDLLNSPPQDLEANIRYSIPEMKSTHAASSKSSAIRSTRQTNPERGIPMFKNESATNETDSAARGNSSGASVFTANRQGTPRSAFTELIANQHLSLWFLVTAALLSMGLGALHAIEPGHGKTIVAAYLVGSRGTVFHATVLGITVTAAHTAGVYLLGAITLYASRYVVPEKLYPWLGLVSGLMIAGVAFFMFLRRWTGTELAHSHAAGEFHSHWNFFAKAQENGSQHDEISSQTAATPANRSVTFRELLTLGLSGGMVPCPAALVVLLSAAALHRVGFGLFLIVAFSMGLAAVLVSIGILMVFAGRMLARISPDRPLITRWLPLLSSVFMMLLGLGLSVQAVFTLGVNPGTILQGRMIPFLGVILIGLVLGMRHSLDPDHVVAVSTIVSRQRSMRSAALIGVLWGIGHTLTIFLVGSAIILFGLVIPPRIGLFMEFSVALMLILLGALNLTGVIPWITERLTPRRFRDTKIAIEKKPSQGASALSDESSLGALDRLVGRFGTYQILRPLIVGTVHGLAGSAAVALLVLSTIRVPIWAIAYLLVFGLGTVVGMMLMTVGMALPITFSGNRFSNLGGYLSYGSGMVSLAFGLFLVYQIGFVDRLFGSNPQWTPH